MADRIWIIKQVGTISALSYQLLHPSNSAVSMAQGIRQPIHSITSLTVPIETDSDSSAGGHKRKGRGDRVVRRRRD